MSLKEMNARARVPSGFRYRARFSGRGVGAVVVVAVGFDAAAFDGFLGDEKKARTTPPFGAGAAGCAGAGAIALNMLMICGSRRIFRVSVNSSLLCSILQTRQTKKINKCKIKAETTSYSSNS